MSNFFKTYGEFEEYYADDEEMQSRLQALEKKLDRMASCDELDALRRQYNADRQRERREALQELEDYPYED